MSRGSAWALCRDRAYVLTEDPQQRHLAQRTGHGTRHPTELEDKRARAARRLVEITASMSTIMAQVASEVSEAVAETLQSARAKHRVELDLAPMTTTASIISQSPTSIQMSGGSSSISTAGGGTSASHDINLASEVAITCSTKCPGRNNSSSGARTAASASATGVVSYTCVLHERDVHLAVSCFQPRDKLGYVLPSTAAPAASPVPLSIALAEYTAAPVSPSVNIANGPEAMISATTKHVASAALESGPIIGLPSNRYEVCLDSVPDEPTAMLMQATLVPADSSSSDMLVAMSASLDKLEGTDTAVTHENEQRQTCLSEEQSLILVAAQDVANNDNLVTGTSGMPLTLAVLGVNDDNIATKHEAIASRTVPPIKLMHSDRNSGIYLHPKFRLHMLAHAPWDPGEHAKHAKHPFLSRDSLLLVSWLQLPPDRVQFNGGHSELHFVPVDSKSMLWDMRIRFQCVTSFAFSLLSSGIQPGTSMFRGTNNFWFQLPTEGYIVIHHGLLVYAWSLAVMVYFAATLIQLSRVIIYQLIHNFSQLQDLLIAIEKLQPWPDWDTYIPGYKMQYATKFGSTPWANQKKYITQDSIGNVAVPCFPFGTAGNASVYGSDIFQWAIAWTFTLKGFDWSFQFRHPCSLAGVNEFLTIMYVSINTLQVPWDPGVCSTSAHRQGNLEGLNDACSNTCNAQSQVLWDPGSSSQDRLGGKPNFKKGDCQRPFSSATCSLGLGWNWAGNAGPRPAQKLAEQLLQIQQEVDSDGGLGQNG